MFSWKMILTLILIFSGWTGLCLIGEKYRLLNPLVSLLILLLVVNSGIFVNLVIETLKENYLLQLTVNITKLKIMC